MEMRFGERTKRVRAAECSRDHTVRRTGDAVNADGGGGGGSDGGGCGVCCVHCSFTDRKRADGGCLVDEKGKHSRTGHFNIRRNDRASRD